MDIFQTPTKPLRDYRKNEMALYQHRPDDSAPYPVYVREWDPQRDRLDVEFRKLKKPNEPKGAYGWLLYTFYKHTTQSAFSRADLKGVAHYVCSRLHAVLWLKIVGYL